MIFIKITTVKDLYDLKGKKAVYYKDEEFFISELNFYTFLKIIKETNPEFYELIQKEDSEIIRLAVNSLLLENKDLTPNETIEYIMNLDVEAIKSIGIDCYEMLYIYLNSYNFQKDDYKGILFLENEIDYQFLFNYFNDLEVLFIYDERTKKLKIVDKNLNTIKTVNIKDIDDVYKYVLKFNKKSLDTEKNKFLNNLIKKFLESFFDLEVFFEEFIDDFIERLISLILITDLSEEVEQILRENIDEFKINKRLIEVIDKKVNKKKENNKILKKYGVSLG